MPAIIIRGLAAEDGVVAPRDDEQQADEPEDRAGGARPPNCAGSTRIVRTLPPAAHSR